MAPSWEVVIRINQPQMQEAVFEVLGIGDVEAREKFGFLWMPSATAVRHTVVLPSFRSAYYADDRLCFDSRCDCFPKTQTAACPLTDAPGLCPAFSSES